jgi:hypothetical protein
MATQRESGSGDPTWTAINVQLEALRRDHPEDGIVALVRGSAFFDDKAMRETRPALEDQ